MLDELKEYLKITWDDENNSLNNIILRGKTFIEQLTGTKINFDTDTQAKSLLLDYCRYAYNNATEYFEENYKSELLRLQLMEGVKMNENKS